MSCKFLCIVLFILSCKNEKVLIHIGGIPLWVEIADSAEERKKGLSERKDIDGGMLFIFEQEGIYPFWMNDTHVPLSIAFIDRDRKITSIQDMSPLCKNRLYVPPSLILYALEVEMGWFEKNNIEVGDLLSYENRDIRR